MLYCVMRFIHAQGRRQLRASLSRHFFGGWIPFFRCTFARRISRDPPRLRQKCPRRSAAATQATSGQLTIRRMQVREAKDFLVQQAAEQARIEGVPLSEL